MIEPTQLKHCVRIVLVNPQQPGNIGGAMRAMKNMALDQLYLVSPEIYPSDRVQWRAAGAIDMQQNTVICDHISEAIADCHYVVGTSARPRRLTIPIDNPKQCASYIATEVAQGHKVAILFGREHSGLTNTELQLCHRHVTIDANEHYPSLNLAAAVQVICYELYQQGIQNKVIEQVWDKPLATAQEIERLLVEAEAVMKAIGFYQESSSKKLLPRLQRLVNRIRPDVMEVQILRGLINRVQELQNQLKH